MAIEWDSLVVEMVLLAAIIYGAIYVESWVDRRKTHKEEEKGRVQIIQFVRNDLAAKLRFIDECIQYRDYKPFFTDMWDAVILGGKQTLLPFALFENLQHTYSWMKYYNNELEQRGVKGGSDGEREVLEVLGEVKKSIEQSLKMLA
ncbi:hypothetical protein [Nitrososphaera sp.]|uniref:hypothetical protein n=1 Tax=Nitrososphaera sp. TaxID=1971748 RepID=UPI00307D81C9